MPSTSVPNDKYIYVWIDILGFRNELEKGSEKIYKDLFDIREEFFSKFNKLRKYTKDIFQISDGLVVVCNVEIDFKELMELIAKLQIEFILEREKLIRGAISLGTISKELYKQRKNDVFLISDGLVKAFKLESEYVMWPVIATTEEFLKEVRDIKKIPNKNELFGLKRMFGTSSGFLYFIDFLEKLPDSKKQKFEKFLEDSIREYENEKHIFEKYYWLLKYYMKKNKSLSNEYLLTITGDEFYG